MTIDIRIVFGSLFEVYKNGVKVDSFYGGWVTSFDKCNRVQCSLMDGFVTQVILADEPTFGMHLLTVPAGTANDASDWGNTAGTFSYDPSGGNEAVNEPGLSASSYIYTSAPDQRMVFDNMNDSRLDITTGGYDVLAVVTAACIRNIPGSSIRDAVFVLTDGADVALTSPLLGAVPDDYARRVQCIWPGTFGATQAAQLKTGIVSQ